MTKFEELMENQEFCDKLDNAGYDEIKAAFAAEGVDLDAELPGDESAELSEEDLDDVAGGLSLKDLGRIVKQSYKMVKSGAIKGAWKFGSSYGILIRAYYDTVRYGNATKTYSEKTILKAARTIGCID